MGAYDKVHAGAGLKAIKSRAWNSAMDVVKHYRDHEGPSNGSTPSDDYPDHLEVLVRNDTGVALDWFQVVELGDAVYTAESTLQNGDIVLKAAIPTDVSKPFGILLEPIDIDTAEHLLAHALAMGVTLAHIAIGDAGHRFAHSTVGDREKLTSAPSGAAEILWKASATGYSVLCVIRLSNTPPTFETLNAGGAANHNLLDGTIHLDTGIHAVADDAIIVGKRATNVLRWRKIDPPAATSGPPGLVVWDLGEAAGSRDKILQVDAAAGAGKTPVEASVVGGKIRLEVPTPTVGGNNGGTLPDGTTGDILVHSGGSWQVVHATPAGAILYISGGVPTWFGGAAGDILVSNGTGWTVVSKPAGNDAHVLGCVGGVIDWIDTATLACPG